MRRTAIKVVAVGAALTGIALTLDKDFAYRWLISTIALGALVIVAVSWPIARTGNRGYSFVGALMFIFAGMFVDSTYRWVFLVSDRAPWVFQNFVHLSFFGLSIIAGGVLHYIDTAGHMSRSSGKFRVLLGLIVAAAFAVSWVLTK